MARFVIVSGFARICFWSLLVAGLSFPALTLNAYAQVEQIPTPMWEGVEKSAADIENDEALITEALKITNGDREAAALSMAQTAWQQISAGNPNDAIRRLNLAWLVKPDLPDLFWAFAIASHMRGDETAAVEKLFDRTESAFDGNPHYLANRGRVLEERQMANEARPWFERALDIDDTFIPAHFGMMRVAMALEDKELEEKHRARFESLTGQANQ